MLTDRYFMPDIYLNDIYEITPEMLKERGIKAVLLDIDNTLVTYDDPKPTESVLKWLDALKNVGISAAFISNNHQERVELFNISIELFELFTFEKCYSVIVKGIRNYVKRNSVFGYINK